MRPRNEILQAIIAQGILNSRLAARNGNSQQALVEADHVHNLPNLIVSKNWTIEHYWNIDRVAYLEHCKDAVFRETFVNLWGELQTALLDELQEK